MGSRQVCRGFYKNLEGRKRENDRMELEKLLKENIKGCIFPIASRQSRIELSFYPLITIVANHVLILRKHTNLDTYSLHHSGYLKLSQSSP